MKLTINGEEKTFPEGMTLASLIHELGIEKNPIAVELNRAVVPRELHGATRLQEGDSLEIVTLVGGG